MARQDPVRSLSPCYPSTANLTPTSLMVLCPFIHLLMRFDTGPLSLQPTEVHSAHWVSLRALLSPQLSTFIGSDVSGRLHRSGSYFARGLARILFGRILVKAIDLVPTESVYCSSGSDFLPPGHRPSINGFVKSPHWLSGNTGWQKPSQQLVLWGLTLGNSAQPSKCLIWWLTCLGVMSDFLRAHPSCNVPDLWAWPTLSPVDYQFFIWLSTYTYRRQKTRDLESKTVTTDTVGGRTTKLSGPGEIDNTTFTILKSQSQKGIQDSDLLEVLGGYYDRAKTAVFLTLALRLGLGGLFASWALRQLQGRRYPS